MKKLSLFALVFVCCISIYTSAITQKINETDGINYGYISSVDVTGKKLSIDYVQYYKDTREVAQAKLEDGCQNHDSFGLIRGVNTGAIQRIRDKSNFSIYMSKRLKKYGKKNYLALYNNMYGNVATNAPFRTPEEYIALECLYEPGGRQPIYIRNTSPKIRIIPTIIHNFSGLDTISLYKMTLKKGKIHTISNTIVNIAAG